MKSNTPYQFSVLKYTYDQFTNESLNIGLALYSPKTNYIKVQVQTKYGRLTAAFPNADGEKYYSYVSRLQTKFNQATESINKNPKDLFSHFTNKDLNLEEILNQIFQVDDSAIHFDRMQFGVSENLEDTFADLYFRLIEKYIPNDESNYNEAKIWHDFSQLLPRPIVYNHLRSIKINTLREDIEFEHAWRNSHFKAIQPLSFDLKQVANIKRKSLQWFGTNVLIDKCMEFDKLYYLLLRPQKNESELLAAYHKAKDLLGTGEFSGKIKIIEEDEKIDFAKDIAKQIEKDTSQNET